MRGLLIAIAVAFLGASPALAKPKVAVTIVGGDSDKMGEAVRDLLDGKLAVVAPKDVERAMSKLGLSGDLEDSQVERLGQKLDAAVVVQGKLGRAGKKKTVKLSVWVRGKKPSDFNVQYKSVESEKFRDAVREALLKRIGSLDDLDDGDRPKKRISDGDDDQPKKKKDPDGDGDKPKKRVADGDDDQPKKKKDPDGDGDKPKKRVADGDDDQPKKKKKDPDGDGDGDGDKPKKKKVASADDDGDGDKPKKKKKVASADDNDGPKARKRKRPTGDGDGDGEGVRERTARPLPAARVDAGFSYAARYLTYKIGSGSTSRPPKVLTPAAAGRFEGEIYPLALSNRESPLAGLGIFGEYDKTFGLSIDVPNTMGKSAPINQAHYSIGARYRLALGKAAISAGVAYARRHYLADRSALAQPSQLDAPDVNYAAISPVLGARMQVGSKLALFAEADAMLVLSAGAISQTANYGAGSVFGIGGNLGVDIALGKQIGLRFAGEYNQINLKFKGTGTMAGVRKVSGATDRDVGMSATFAAMF